MNVPKYYILFSIVFQSFVKNVAKKRGPFKRKRKNSKLVRVRSERGILKLIKITSLISALAAP